MADVTKIYLHDATSADSGTLPSTVWRDTATGTLTLTGSATGAATCRNADLTIGAGPAQTATFTANANTTAQVWALRRWVTPPLAAGSCTSAALGFGCTFVESNTNHNAQPTFVCYFWRPSTGALVGAQGSTVVPVEPGTTASWQSAVASGSSNLTASWSDGDVLVIELTDPFTQSMAVAYTSSATYDGTTEGSASTPASYLSLGFSLSLLAASAVSLVDPGSRGQHSRAIPHLIIRAQKLGREWRRRESGLLEPVYV